jgi:hypothetical protein
MLSLCKGIKTIKKMESVLRQESDKIKMESLEALVKSMPTGDIANSEE